MNEITSRNNPHLFGHDEAEAMLLREFASGKFAHGWIIAGPEGIGKATLAYRFARHVLGAPKPSPSGRGLGEGVSSLLTSHAGRDPHPGPLPGGEGDNIFHRVAAGSHTDLLVVEPAWNEKKEEFASDITVDQARTISQFMSLTPGEGDWRVVIIDSADALNNNGANAILKILEEPPPQAVLLLISHNPGRLLPTIRSRCRTLRLKPLSDRDFSDALRHVLPQAESSPAALAQLSGYAPGIAVRLEEEGAVALYGQILDLFCELPALDTLKLHAFADQVMAGKAHANWQLLLRLVLILFERAARKAAGEPLTAITPDEPDVLARLTGLHPAHVWAAKWQQAADQFSLAQSRHLDYKQVLITFIHSIASTEILAASA